MAKKVTKKAPVQHEKSKTLLVLSHDFGM